MRTKEESKMGLRLQVSVIGQTVMPWKEMRTQREGSVVGAALGSGWRGRGEFLWGPVESETQVEMSNSPGEELELWFWSLEQLEV